MPKDTTTTKRTPDWVTSTPPDNFYSLTMFQNGFGVEEIDDIDRDEYITLKEHLAAMRGYGYAEQMAAFVASQTEKAAFPDGADRVDLEQLALGLDDAQEFYRNYPALVMGVMPVEWKEICKEHSTHEDGPKDAKTSHDSTADIAAPAFKNATDEELKLLQWRSGCLANVSRYLLGASEDGIILLHDIALECNFSGIDNYADSLQMAMDILKEFAHEQGIGMNSDISFVRKPANAA